MCSVYCEDMYLSCVDPDPGIIPKKNRIRNRPTLEQKTRLLIFIIVDIIKILMHIFKVIRKFFLSITKVLDGISGITKNIIFFTFEGL